MRQGRSDLSSVGGDGGGRLRRFMRRGISLGVVAVLAVLADRPAQAAPTHTLSIVPVGSPAADVPFEGQTFSAVASALIADSTPVVPLPVPGFDGSISGVPTVVTTDSPTRTIALTSEIAAPLSGLGPTPAELLLLAQWDSSSDTDPDLVLALRFTTRALGDLFPAWVDLAELPGEIIDLDEAVLAFTEVPVALAEASLPPVVDAFFGLDAGGTLDLDEVATLVDGAIDLADSIDALDDLVQLLGLNSVTALDLSGSLADTAEFLFDPGAAVDPSAFSLDGPLVVDSGDLPDFLTPDWAPSFELRLGPAPQRTPSIQVADSFTVDAGGEQNTFSYAVSLQDAGDLTLSAQATSFAAPYGLGWMGTFDDVSLLLFAEEGSGALGLSIEATVPIGATPPKALIEVRSAAEGTAGLVSIAGDVHLDDVVDWLAGSGAFTAPSFDSAALASVVLHELELTYDGEGSRRVLGAFADTSLPVPFTVPQETVNARALLAVTDPDAGGPTAATLLAALKVVDPACAPAECIRLGTVLPIPGGDLAANLTVPAVNLLTIQPNGAAFDPTGLASGAAAFLDEVLGAPASDPVVIPGSLSVRADLPLAPLDGALAALGITLSGTDPELHLEADLDVTLSSLAGDLEPSLSSLDITATIPGTTLAAPPVVQEFFDGIAALGFPADLTPPPTETGDAELFVRFDAGDPGTDLDDAVAVGVSLPEVETDLLGSDVTLSFEGTLTGNPGAGQFTAALRAELAEPWVAPFDVGWVTIDGAFLEAILTVDGDDVSGELALGGQVTVGPVPLEVTLRLSSSPPKAVLTIGLLDTVTVEDVLDQVAPSLLTIGIPPNILSTGFGPGELTVEVTPNGVKLDAEVDFTVPFVPGGEPLEFSALLSVGLPDSGSPRFTFGLRPTSTLTLGGLLGQALPVDFTLVDDDAALGLVLSNEPFDATGDELTDTARGWFDPLLLDGAPPSTRTVPAGIKALGVFNLPADIAGAVNNLGVQPAVQLAGTIPIPGSTASGVTFGVELAMVATPEALPWFIDDASISLGVSLTTGPPPKLSFTASGQMTLLIKQGIEQGLAQDLASVGITGIPVAPVVDRHADPDAVCSEGGVIEPGEDPEGGEDPADLDHFCMDPLILSIGGTLSAEPTAVELAIQGSITSANEAAGYHPLGFDFVSLRQIIGRVFVRFEPVGPKVTMGLGLLANVEMADKQFDGAVQFGVSVQPAPTPIGVAITPSFDGIRLAAPDGLFTQDLLDIYDAVGDLTGAPGLPVPTGLPNIGLRNLEFSLSPLGVKDLCIAQGLVVSADLYVNPPADFDPQPRPTCNPDTFAPQPAPPDGALCAANKGNGCVAGMFFSFGPAGIAGNGFLAGFDLRPVLPISFEDAEVAFRLTLTEQYLRVSGGVTMGDPPEPVASGRLAINLEPTKFRFFGRLQVLGFNALVEAHVDALGTANPLDPSSFNPNMLLRVVLADTGADMAGAGGADFADALVGYAGPVLDDLERVVTFLDAVLDDLAAGDPLGVLLGLPDRLEAAGIHVDVPAWLDELIDRAAVLTTEIAGYGEALTLDLLLNGPDFDGVETDFIPETRTCYGGFDFDTLQGTEGTVTEFLGVELCWSIVNVVPGLFVDPICPGTVKDDTCYLLGLEPLDLPGVCDLFPGLFPDCSVEGIRDQIEALLTEALGDLLDFVAGTDLGEVIDAIRGADGPLFALECAEFELALSLQGGNTVDLSLDSTVFGHDLAFAIGWDFEDPIASTDALLAEFWALLTGQGSTGSCTGVDAELAALLDPGDIGGLDPVLSLPPLTLSVGAAPTTMVEGSTVTLTGSLNRNVDVDADGPQHVTVTWGDGDQDVVAVPDGTRAFSAQHTYVDDGPSPGNGTASDVATIAATLTAGASDTATVTVRNARPRIDTSLDTASIDEGEAVALTVGITDVGVDDVHSLSISWGDGTTQTVPNAASNAVYSHTYTDDAPSGTASDDMRIVVTVTDDDTGRATGAETLTVANVAPGADDIILTPGTVAEGTLARYTISFTDPGTLDTHRVHIDWDGDGSFDTTRHVAAGQRSVTATHRYVDDGPSPGNATAADITTVGIRVEDDDTGVAEVVRDITVENVEPVVCLTFDPDGFQQQPAGGSCPQVVAPTIDEGDSVTVTASFTDPGRLDAHTVTIDWGDGHFDQTVLNPSTGTRTFTATSTYGDNGTFPILVSVTDDDLGVGEGGESVEVNNVDPSAVIDETAAVMLDGPDDDAVLDTPTFVTRAGASTPFSARSLDPGSDDLRFLWDWDKSDRFDSSTTSSTDRVNPPADDPFPSPSLQPRDVTSSVAHAWSQPCTYEVTVRVTDDDAGGGTDSTWVIVTGTDDRVRAPGWWYNQYDASKKKNSQALPQTTLSCYLEVVDHMSQVFDSFRVIDTFLQARDVLNTRQTSSDAEIMVRQLLATWLNVAHGSLAINQLVDTDGDAVVDARLLDVLQAAEAARMDPQSTRSQLLGWEDVLQRINGS